MSRAVAEFLPLLQKRIDKLRAEMTEATELSAIGVTARLREAEFIQDFLTVWDSAEIEASVFYARQRTPR